MLDVADKRWFTGIPSPAAAALVAGFVWIIDDYGIDPQTRALVGAGASRVFAGLTMVSNVKYYSFKTINLKKSVPFVAIFAVRARRSRCCRYQPAARAVRRLRRLRAVGLRRFGVDVVLRAAAGVAPAACRRR